MQTTDLHATKRNV